MKLLLKIFFSFLLVQLATSETEDEFEENLHKLQEQHEQDHVAHRLKNMRTRRTTAAPQEFKPPDIDERCPCIPYEEYITSINVQFENDTMAKQGEKVYRRICDSIDQHNALYSMMIFTYAQGKNQMIHIPFEDALPNLAGTVMPRRSRSLTIDDAVAFFPEPTGEAVNQVDFCSIHNPVRDQGSCGSCYAFATVAILEALYQRVNGISICASEQMIVDCDKVDFGCNGGWPADTLKYIENYGLSTCTYEYTGVEESCKKKKHKRSVDPKKITPVEIPLFGDEDLLKRIVAEKGSVAVFINIDPTLYTYATGVYINDECSKTDVNHAVVICGYGVDPVYGPYWVVRNSWSELWGELGYIKIARGRNTCGIATTAAVYAEFSVFK